MRLWSLPMQPKVQLFSNPYSGTYSARRIARLRRAFESAGAQVTQSESSMLAAPEVDPGATHICVAGGDGTVRHVAAALAAGGHAIPIAQYPLGTINLLAREAGYHPNPRRFAERFLADRERRRHHTATVRDQMFLCCASAGPECAAIRGYSPALKRRIGRFAYAVALARTVLRWERHAMVLHAEGHSFPCEAVYIAKGRYFAGQWSFAPKASLTDDKLHVVALGTARRRDYLRFLLDLVLGRDPGARPGNLSLTCSHLSLEGAEHIEVQADGDLLATLPLEIRSGGLTMEFI
jgi:diacylglycerol kinase family enzyme